MTSGDSSSLGGRGEAAGDSPALLSRKALFRDSITEFVRMKARNIDINFN